MLKLGALVAAKRGKGAANAAHFRRLNLPLGSVFAKRMQQRDNLKRKLAQHRSSEDFKVRERIRRSRTFQNHAVCLTTPEVSMYKKDGFSDHQYAKQLPEE